MDYRVASVFLDANVVLHYKRADEIDWCKLAHADEVLLVAAPILLRELEFQKVHNQSRKLRDRAANYIRWLAAFVRDPSLFVRPRVRWVFIAHEPLIDLTAHRLAPSVADDQLIASIMTYEAGLGQIVFVATADIGLEIKLRNRGITPLLLPDEVKLPPERDEAEKELEKLRRQVAERRVPRLGLRSKDGEDRVRITLAVPPLVAPKSLEQIKAGRPLLSRRSPEGEKGRSPALNLNNLVFNAFLSQENVERHNKELAQYYQNYETYLVGINEWRQFIATCASVRLELANSGTAPASDIDVVLTLPESLEAVAALPEAPTPPDPPRTPYELGLGLPTTKLYIPDAHLLSPNRRVHMKIESNRHQVSFTVSTLKHGHEQKLNLFYIRFRSAADVRSFKVGYTISAAEVPEHEVGDVHFIVPEACP